MAGVLGARDATLPDGGLPARELPARELPDGGLPAREYALIYADPPWSFVTYSDRGLKKSAQRHYSCSPAGVLREMAVGDLAAQNSVLAMWATFPMLPQAIGLMDAWGFTYKTGGAWGKMSKGGGKVAFGTGYIFRSAAELLLVGTRGKPVWGNRRTRNLWLAPVREHSRKPDEVRDLLAALVPGPRIELFARSRHEGWDAWGNEVGKLGGADV